MGSLGDGYEKTYEPLIFYFTLIKKFDIYDKNYSCRIDLSTFNCIIHIDRTSLLPAMLESNMD